MLDVLIMPLSPPPNYITSWRPLPYSSASGVKGSSQGGNSDGVEKKSKSDGWRPSKGNRIAPEPETITTTSRSALRNVPCIKTNDRILDEKDDDTIVDVVHTDIDVESNIPEQLTEEETELVKIFTGRNNNDDENAQNTSTSSSSSKPPSVVSRQMKLLVRAFSTRSQRVKRQIIEKPPTPETSDKSDEQVIEEELPVQFRLRLESFGEDDTNVSLVAIERRGFKRLLSPWDTTVDPQSKTYISWLFVVALCYLYNSFSIFLRSVFYYEEKDYRETLHIFLTFDYICDAVYLADIIFFKMRLKFYVGGMWISDPALARKNYFSKMDFKLDALALVPSELMYIFHEGVHPIFRLPRMLKIKTFWEFFDRIDAIAKSPYIIRVLRTQIYMMFLIHLNACVYYAMSAWEGIGVNQFVFQGGNRTAYIRCFYFAFKTATSIGKNAKPTNELEYIYMTFSWLMGVFIFAFLLGQIRDIVATATKNKTEFRSVMDQCVDFLRRLNLPKELQSRVRMWLNHTWEQQKTLDENSILSTLPRKMKTDIALSVFYETLSKVKFFERFIMTYIGMIRTTTYYKIYIFFIESTRREDKRRACVSLLGRYSLTCRLGCERSMMRDMVVKLKSLLFLPGDYICKKGEIGTEMYIVNKGVIRVLGGENNDVILATLKEGTVFGEVSLLGIAGCNRRTANVQSVGFSNLYVLTKDDLKEVLVHYPNIEAMLQRRAMAQLKKNVKSNEQRMKEDNSVTTNKLEVEPIIGNTTRPKTPQFVNTVLKVLKTNSVSKQRLEGSARIHPIDMVQPAIEKAKSVSRAGHRDNASKIFDFYRSPQSISEAKSPTHTLMQKKVSTGSSGSKNENRSTPPGIMQVVTRCLSAQTSPPSAIDCIPNPRTPRIPQDSVRLPRCRKMLELRRSSDVSDNDLTLEENSSFDQTSWDNLSVSLSTDPPTTVRQLNDDEFVIESETAAPTVWFHQKPCEDNEHDLDIISDSGTEGSLATGENSSNDISSLQDVSSLKLSLLEEVEKGLMRFQEINPILVERHNLESKPRLDPERDTEDENQPERIAGATTSQELTSIFYDETVILPTKDTSSQD